MTFYDIRPESTPEEFSVGDVAMGRCMGMVRLWMRDAQQRLAHKRTEARGVVGKVVKDQYNQLVLDVKHRVLGGSIYRFQVRWTSTFSDGTLKRYKRRFDREDRDTAERVHRRLKEAEGQQVWSDDLGMPNGSVPKVPAAHRTIDDVPRSITVRRFSDARRASTWMG